MKRHAMKRMYLAKKWFVIWHLMQINHTGYALMQYSHKLVIIAIITRKLCYRKDDCAMRAI